MWQLIKKNNLYFILFFIFILTGICFLFTYSKPIGFLLINGHYSPFSDRFFFILTAFGSGWLYLPFIIFLGLLNIRWSIALTLTFCIQTLLVQSLKLLIFPEVLRPALYFPDNQLIHYIKGITNLLYHSFPSGHTASAFSICTVLVFIVGNRYWSIFMFLLAFLVGYSRIYLAQHFPIDVFFGSFIGLLSAITGYWLACFKLQYKWLDFKIIQAK
jgi:membrane-associated phospholipid phosphatase